MRKLTKVLPVLFLIFLAALIWPLFNRAYAEFECNNGPNSSDSNNCGTPCYEGNPWSKYKKEWGDWSQQGWYYYPTPNFSLYYMTYSCSTGSKCIGDDTGLRYGYCDCTASSSIYAMCCAGATAKKCTKLDYDNLPPPEGTCSPYEQRNGVTSCASDSGGGSQPTPSDCLVPYNNACPKGFVLKAGCCVCP